MPIKNVDIDTCTGCGVCVDTCPEDVLHLDTKKKKAYIAYPQDCVACLLCEFVCPVKCIEVTWDMARPIPMPY